MILLNQTSNKSLTQLITKQFELFYAFQKNLCYKLEGIKKSLNMLQKTQVFSPSNISTCNVTEFYAKISNNNIMRFIPPVPSTYSDR